MTKAYYTSIITKFGGEWEFDGMSVDTYFDSMDAARASIVDELPQVWCLGDEPLPEGIEDISGTVNSEPLVIYAFFQNDGHGGQEVVYVGIDYRQLKKYEKLNEFGHIVEI